MTLLKNRAFAITLTVIVCVAMLLIGIGRSSRQQVAQTRALFEEGVPDSLQSYRKPSIAEQLEARSNAALGLIGLANSLPEAADACEAVRSAREDLLNAQSLSAKCRANQALTDACSRLIPLLEDGLTEESKQSALSTYANTLENANRLIDTSGYNEAADALQEDVLNHFPVRLLHLLGFYPCVERFEVTA